MSVEPDAGPIPSGIAEESLRSRMARGVVWNLIGTGALQGSTFVINVALANLLGIRVFGEYAIVQSTVVLLSSMVQWPTGYTATKYLAEFRSVDRQRTGRLLGLLTVASIALGGIAALILLASARSLAAGFLNNAELATPLMIASAAVFLGVTNLFLTGALGGLESYPAIGRAGLMAAISNVLACIVGAWVAGLIGAVIGLTLGGLVQCVILWRVVNVEIGRHNIPMQFRGLRVESGLLVRYSLPVALSGLIALPAIWLGNALLVRQPAGYDEMAVFAAANGFRAMVVFLPGIVNVVSMSLLNNQRGLGNAVRFRRVFWLNLTMTVLIVISGATGIALSGPRLLTFFGQEFARGYPVLLVLMGVTILESVSNSLIQLVQSRERSWLALVGVTLPCFATLALMAWLLTPIAGSLGLAWAYLVAWSVALPLTGVVVLKLGVRPTEGDVRVAGVSTQPM
jgi:O-antigen/teichoic acid export membrane protein